MQYRSDQPPNKEGEYLYKIPLVYSSSSGYVY